MQVVASAGRDDLARVYIARDDAGRYIEFVESLQPPWPREKKWVLIVSCLYGCPFACRICDAGGELPRPLEPGRDRVPDRLPGRQAFSRPRRPLRKIQDPVRAHGRAGPEPGGTGRHRRAALPPAGPGIDHFAVDHRPGRVRGFFPSACWRSRKASGPGPSSSSSPCTPAMKKGAANSFRPGPGVSRRWPPTAAVFSAPATARSR